MKKGLVILHIDGVSYSMLLRAMNKGYLPHLTKFIEEKNYKIDKYWCGLPSTTPYCQAGLLYGDNQNIPGFRWWDKKIGRLITFGRETTFQKVSHRYFKKHPPLLQNGACIAACYSAGAKEALTLIYKEKKSYSATHIRIALLLRWYKNPIRIIDWLFNSVVLIIDSLIELIHTYLKRSQISVGYFLKDIVNELFIHHITRFAVRKAMQREFPIIFAGFYSYDEIAHAFGPNAPLSYKTLYHIDQSIKYITKYTSFNDTEYEFVFLSDHGNIDTVPFTSIENEHLADKLARILPNYIIEEIPGKVIEPVNHIDGHILFVFSGQLANVYIKNISGRLRYSKLKKLYPKLLNFLINEPEIAFLMMKDGKNDVILTEKKIMKLQNRNGEMKKFLATFGDPKIIKSQLKRLNNNNTAGDIIFFGTYKNNAQVTFENQVGSHSALGGEQMTPFILTRKKWNLPLSDIRYSSQLHGKMMMLKKQLGIV
jgi:hypothetical protein